ncbi:hypothetical protein ABT336_12960 [Micromonospora sp. NPDC000207]|uniref:hypothetical protein n=1 Tax=Micromonospora sp. NPDC000207 TaxID=3154246 RepID=UPI00332E80DE
MSYPDPAAAPTAPTASAPTDRRPGTVTVAATVLLVMAVAAIGSAVVTLVGLPGIVDRFRSDVGTAAGPDEVGATVTLVRAVVWSSALLTVLVSVLLVGLAVGLRAGRPGARTAVWVVGGLGLVGGCCSVAVLAGQRAVPLLATPAARRP